jgi:hypothetical protein
MDIIKASIDEKTNRPVIEIEGDWIGKNIKLVIKMLPRAYRLYKADRLKEAKGVKHDGRKQTKRAGTKTATA